MNPDGLANSRRVALKVPLKPTIAGDGHGTGTGRAVVRLRDNPTQGRSNSEDIKIAAGDQIDLDMFYVSVIDRNAHDECGI